MHVIIIAINKIGQVQEYLSYFKGFLYEIIWYHLRNADFHFKLTFSQSLKNFKLSLPTLQAKFSTHFNAFQKTIFNVMQPELNKIKKIN